MAYVKILYQDSPSTATPLNAQNLNHMDDQIAENDRRLNELATAGVVNTFNSRTGNVTSEKGDYDINQIVASDGQEGYIPVWRNSGTEQEPDWGFAMEEMGGSGHKILDADGNEMAQEDALQFADAFLTDDSVNGRTVVENIKEVDPADYDSTTDEGIIVTDDGNDALIGAVSDDYVEVEGDGTKTFAQMFNALFTDVDTTKITNDSILVYQLDSSRKNVFHFVGKSATQYVFTFNEEYESSGNINISTWVARIGSSSNFYYSENGLSGDASGNTMPSGRKFILYYGNRKATVDLQTTANRCLMSDGVTSVESAINNIFHIESVSVENRTIVANGGYGISCPAVSGKTPVFARYKTTTGYNVIFVTSPLFRENIGWSVSLYSIHNQSLTTSGVVEIYYL